MVRRSIRSFALAVPLALALGSGAVLLPQTALAVQDAPAETGAALLQQAKRFEAAAQWKQAAEAYGKAAAAFEKEKNTDANISALEKSALMFEKYADALVKGTARRAQQAPPAAKQAEAPRPAAGVNPPVAGLPLALEESAVVNRSARGGLAVSQKDGRPIDGVKLSRHDADIHNPGIAVAPDGTIHVAFVERRAETPYTYAVYHRSSSDGGKSWSDAKNLSEVLPDYVVGNCRIATDGANRVYVIWRTGYAENVPDSGTEPHAAQTCNSLYYRVLENGAWSGKAILVHPAATRETSDMGSASWFVATDPTGKVHVVWNQYPSRQDHPEFYGHGYRDLTIGIGQVKETTLDGKDPGQPREIYMAKVTKDKAFGTPRCDHYDTINGYVDAAGQAHFLARAHVQGITPEPNNRFVMVENGSENLALTLPGSVSGYWQYPPTLLVDAKGQRHIIAWYKAGEQPNIRDYVVGSDAEPTVIRASKEVKGKVIGFQAFQGSAGRMVVLMQMNDTGKETDDELYVSMSDGGKWSAPVNVTNNTGKFYFISHSTSIASHVATSSYWYPGPGAAAFDRQGHLVLTYISKEHSIVASQALGVTLAGGSTVTPKLRFLRF